MQGEEMAKMVKKELLRLSHKRKIPHLGSCFSCADILACLYCDVMDQNSHQSTFVLSKGHAAAIYLLILEKLELCQGISENIGLEGSIIHEHPPSPKVFSGVEAATGSLGHGLAIGLGLAYADMLAKNGQMNYVLVGDGECNEGSIWEAASVAGRIGLSNLCVIVDYNKWQATGRYDDLSGGSLVAKWESFGWETLEINGHDYEEMKDTFAMLNKNDNRPRAVIADTVKGKGVSYMENNNDWHYKIPDAQELAQGLKELSKQ